MKRLMLIVLAGCLGFWSTGLMGQAGGGRHALVVHQGQKGFEGGVLENATVGKQGISLAPEADLPASFTSRIIVASRPFNELLPSWNVETPEGSGFNVELQVRANDGDKWSPWLAVGEWGTPPPQPERVVEYELGRIAIDYFTSKRLFKCARYRITARGAGPLRVARVALCFSNRFEQVASARRRPSGSGLWRRRLKVPFRSQGWVAEKKIRGLICSPASVAMVMAYRGVDRPTIELARSIYDKRHGIYGNWTRAVQGGFVAGVPGYVRRFGEWSAVEDMIAADQPLVISIAFEKGQLDGAPFSQSNGHLLVLCGFDRQGNVEVNDPAAREASRGQTVYRRDQLQKAWLDRGGTSYVFLPPR